MRKEIRHLISQLKKHEISFYDIPEEWQNDYDLIKFERKTGLRKVHRCGYDVISDHFYAEEEIGDNLETLKVVYFDEFTAFFDYMEGNIFDRACYYQLPQEKVPGEIEYSRLLKLDKYIDKTIDDYVLYLSEDEKKEYKKSERRKKRIKDWVTRFNHCETYTEFINIIQEYEKSKLIKTVDINFFLWNYIFADTNNEERFDVIMKYVSLNPRLYQIRYALCSIYDPDVVVNKYSQFENRGSSGYRHIADMKRFAENYKKGEYELRYRGYFDTTTHYYCVETNGFAKNTVFRWPVFKYFEYYESIEEFVSSLDGDLRSCDISKAQNINYDFSNCITDSTTSLPVSNDEEYLYTVKKEYSQSKFSVLQLWTNKKGNVIKKYKHIFDYFSDFVSFLKGDLSDADLISCDGLINLVSLDGIDLSGALVTSSISNKFHLPINRFKVSIPTGATLDYVNKNETETYLILQDSRDLSKNVNKDFMSMLEAWSSASKKIYYISDIHLYHLLKNKTVQTKTDVIKVIRDLVSTIINESEENAIILINGDTSLDYPIFQRFVIELEKHSRTIVFTIGNHDMWSCPDDTIDQLAQRYRSFLQDHEMYLLHNDIMYFEEFYCPPKKITEEEIISIPEKDLRALVRKARLIIFGGTGFSGYNQESNAKNGLYRYNKSIGYNSTIEINETKRFENLYKKVRAAFSGKNVIIMTHMPLPDWYEFAVKPWEDHSLDCSSEYYEKDIFQSYEKGFVYLSGHNHRNYYYDDGDIRIYADNQFGYNINNPSAWPHLKYFEIEKAIDYFSDYKDGVYEISRDEYKHFYRCKNITMDFNRETNIIFMLKKNNYYCFIHKSKQKLLSIMNGGALKRLDEKDINYYYENMDLVINYVKGPLEKYTEYQNSISKEIKKIGGKGTIHGCIVDIDFYSHIYINPSDGTISAYYASDIVNKLVYPTILALLKAQCPSLFDNYRKLISNKTNKDVSILTRKRNKAIAIKSIPYYDTDIYTISRQVKKFQKLNSNILVTWPDRLPQPKMIESTNT